MFRPSLSKLTHLPQITNQSTYQDHNNTQHAWNFKTKAPIKSFGFGQQPLTLSHSKKNPKLALSDLHWKSAMQEEFDALIKNKTRDLVPRPCDVNIIRSMWIFRHKKKSNGSFERYKARLVGDGRSQKAEVDCDETFSPVVKPATIRTVLNIALSNSWPIHQLDVQNAFLHGKLHETIYMHQPMGFRGPTHPDYVCLLKKISIRPQTGSSGVVPTIC